MKNLIVWQKAHQLTLASYRNTVRFLADEEYRQLDGSIVEVKKMLAGLIKKIEADRVRADG
jgi:uncharacterized protein (DUF302 family)